MGRQRVQADSLVLFNPRSNWRWWTMRDPVTISTTRMTSYERRDAMHHRSQVLAVEGSGEGGFVWERTKANTPGSPQTQSNFDKTHDSWAHRLDGGDDRERGEHEERECDQLGSNSGLMRANRAMQVIVIKYLPRSSLVISFEVLRIQTIQHSRMGGHVHRSGNLIHV